MIGGLSARGSSGGAGVRAVTRIAGGAPKPPDVMPSGSSTCVASACS